MSDLGDFFSLIGEEKKKKEEKNKELIGEVSLGDLFTSLSEEKKKQKEKQLKKDLELEKIKKEAKIFENLFFSQPKPVDTTDWRDDYKPIEIESEDIIKPEPLKPSEPIAEVEELEESVEELETLAKIRDDVDVEVDKSNNILKSIEILDKIRPEEEIDETGTDSEVSRLRREIDQLRKMVYETVRHTSTIGGGGAGFIKDLDDVSVSGIQSGCVLTWDAPNNKWVPRAASSQVDLGPLANVAAASTTSISQGETLSYETSTGQFITTSTVGAATTNIGGYPITGSAPGDNNVITFNQSSGQWEYDTPFTIVDLSDGVEDNAIDYGAFQ